MYSYLIVLLSARATSFCYYENRLPDDAGNGLMPIDTLKQVVDYAGKNRLALNFIYPDHTLPKEYGQIIEPANHIKIVPFSLRNHYPEAVYVIDDFNRREIEQIKKNAILNLILRLKKADLPLLSENLRSLYYRFNRLNLILLDIPAYTQADFDEYSRQLEMVEKVVTDFYHQGQSMEISFISDRMLLMGMNNCDAGIKHLTIAPDGRFYICPAFYYHDRENSLGDIKEGIRGKNNHLLKLEYAPICSKCDAYHCKRCIYLNKTTTLEVNTPSHQQCVISHLERNTSKKVLDALHGSGKLQHAPPIAELNYLDPFEIASKRSLSDSPRKTMSENRLEKEIPVEEMTDRDILIKIYTMQKEILKRLANKP
jgi:CXXX repeat peptide maturase